MLALSSSQSREKQITSAHNIPKPCRRSMGRFSLLCFFLKHGRAFGARSCPMVLPRLLQHPLSAPAPTGINSMEKAQDPVQWLVMPSDGKAWCYGAECPPGTPRTLSLIIRARANSPASSRKGTGKMGGVVNGSWDFSPQPPQSWRVGFHNNS